MMRDIGRFAKCALEEKPLLIISYESAAEPHADAIQAIRDVGLLILDDSRTLEGRRLRPGQRVRCEGSGASEIVSDGDARGFCR